MAEQKTLVVDLDGTLLRTDTLWESFWAATARNWLVPFRAAWRLLSGRAALKAELAQAGALEPAELPVNEDVVARAKAWREAGGRTALVTAADQAIARQMADHFGVFDEAHGSDGKTNLKGAAKARFLTEKFGEKGFRYVGDSTADVAVWKQSAGAITVNAPERLRRAAETAAGSAEHIGEQPLFRRAALKAMRPHQWAKNLLVFVPMLTSQDSTVGTLILCLVAFVAFSLVASSVYLLNDLLDLSSDRAHPRKRNRPFASGALPLAPGSLLALFLLAAGLAVGLLGGLYFFLVLIGYFALTLAYSLVLKRRLVVDICVLAGLYTVRIIGGGVASDIVLSVWLLAFSIFIFFSLAAVKRQAELVDRERTGDTAAHGREYQVDDLPIVRSMAITSGYLSVLVFALYLNSPDIQDLYPRQALLWGICPVLLYWISRMVMAAHRGRMDDDPLVFAFRDQVSLLSIAIICLIAGFAAIGA